MSDLRAYVLILKNKEQFYCIYKHYNRVLRCFKTIDITRREMLMKGN